ncbi:MAG: hypothetical protein AB1730_01410 [Myxococcota bacterium]
MTTGYASRTTDGSSTSLHALPSVASKTNSFPFCTLKLTTFVPRLRIGTFSDGCHCVRYAERNQRWPSCDVWMAT